MQARIAFETQNTFKIIRRFILDFQPPALRRAIHLSRMRDYVPFFSDTGKNWIPESVTKQVVTSFRWSPEEIAHMLNAVDPEDWGRATLGQSLDVLLYEDPNVVAKLHIAIHILLKDNEATQAVRAATLALTHSCDQRIEVESLVEEFPDLLDHEWFSEVCASVRDVGNLSLY